MNNQTDTKNIQRALNLVMLGSSEPTKDAKLNSKLVYSQNDLGICVPLTVKENHIDSVKSGYEQLLAYIDLQSECEQNNNFIQKMDDVLGIAFSLWDKDKLFINQVELHKAKYYITCYLVKARYGIDYYLVMGIERFDREQNVKYFIPAIQIEVLSGAATGSFYIIQNFVNTDELDVLSNLCEFMEIKFYNKDDMLPEDFFSYEKYWMEKSKANIEEFSDNLINKLKSVTPIEAFSLMINMNMIFNDEDSNFEKYDGKLNDLFQSESFQKTQKELAGRLELVGDLFDVSLLDNSNTKKDIIKFAIHPNNEVLKEHYFGRNIAEILSCHELNIPVVDGYDVSPADILQTMPFDITFLIYQINKCNCKNINVKAFYGNDCTFVNFFNGSLKKLKENIVNFMFDNVFLPQYLAELDELHNKLLSEKQRKLVEILQDTDNEVIYRTDSALRTFFIKKCLKTLEFNYISELNCLSDLYEKINNNGNNNVIKFALGNLENMYVVLDSIKNYNHVPLHWLIYSNKVMSSTIDWDNVKVDMNKVIIPIKNVNDTVFNSLKHLSDFMSCRFD